MTSRIRLSTIALAATAIMIPLVSYLFLGSAAHSAITPTEHTLINEKAQATISEITAFQRPVGPADAPPASETTITGVVRKIGPSTARVWGSVTSRDEVCVQVAGGASACAPPEAFGEAPLVVGGSSGPGVSSAPATLSPKGESELAGIARNGIATVSVKYADGTAETASVVNNGFSFAPAGRQARQFEWKTTAGVTHASPVFGAHPQGG